MASAMAIPISQYGYFNGGHLNNYSGTTPDQLNSYNPFQHFKYGFPPWPPIPKYPFQAPSYFYNPMEQNQPPFIQPFINSQIPFNVQGSFTPPYDAAFNPGVTNQAFWPQIPQSAYPNNDFAPDTIRAETSEPGHIAKLEDPDITHLESIQDPTATVNSKPFEPVQGLATLSESQVPVAPLAEETELVTDFDFHAATNLDKSEDVATYQNGVNKEVVIIVAEPFEPALVLAAPSESHVPVGPFVEDVEYVKELLAATPLAESESIGGYADGLKLASLPIAVDQISVDKTAVTVETFKPETMEVNHHEVVVVDDVVNEDLHADVLAEPEQQEDVIAALPEPDSGINILPFEQGSEEANDGDNETIDEQTISAINVHRNDEADLSGHDIQDQDASEQANDQGQEFSTSEELNNAIRADPDILIGQEVFNENPLSKDFVNSEEVVQGIEHDSIDRGSVAFEGRSEDQESTDDAMDKNIDI